MLTCTAAPAPALAGLVAERAGLRALVRLDDGEGLGDGVGSDGRERCAHGVLRWFAGAWVVIAAMTHWAHRQRPSGVRMMRSPVLT